MDIYGRTSLTYGGGFSHDQTSFSLNLGAGGGVLSPSFIIQRFAVAYAKRLSKVFEFGKPNFYYIEGPPDGNLQLDSLVGPQGLILNFLQKLGDICAAEQSILELEVKSGCAPKAGGRGAAKPSKLKMTHALADNTAVSGEAQTSLIQSQIRIMFGSLEQV